MRLTPNLPPPPADPRALAPTFEDVGDELADDLDTQDPFPAVLVDPVGGAAVPEDRGPRIRRKRIEG